MSRHHDCVFSPGKIMSCREWQGSSGGDPLSRLEAGGAAHWMVQPALIRARGGVMRLCGFFDGITEDTECLLVEGEWPDRPVY